MKELELIERLAKIFGRPRLPEIGLGDDAALLRLRPDVDWVWTTDSQVEDIHFRKKWMRPRQIGQRAATATLSDIAAMGGNPAYALISFHSPRNRVNELLDIARGLADRCREFETQVMGGNVTRSSTLAIDLSVLGWTKKARALRRGGVRPGDDIYVTGFPGRAALALALLNRFGTKAHRFPSVQAWMNARPQIEIGKKLSTLATAAIDISDGLVADARQLAKASRVDLELDLAALPSTPLLEKHAKILRRQFLEFVLLPGDDYELLFSAPRGARKHVLTRSKKYSAVRIGQAKRGAGEVHLVNGGTKVAMKSGGWDHFIKY